MAPLKRPTDRRERLLAVGVREFSRGAYEEVSTERIAEQAGVAQGLLFHYFKTKRNFWEQVMHRITEEQETALAQNTHRDAARWLREELELFLFGLTEYPPALLRQGPGRDSDHLGIIEARQDRAANRVIARMGIEEPSPLLYLAVRGWLGFSLSAGRMWLESPAVTRAQVLALLTETLHGTLEQVAGVEPGTVEPAFFRPAIAGRRGTGSRAATDGSRRPRSGRGSSAVGSDS